MNQTILTRSAGVLSALGLGLLVLCSPLLAQSGGVVIDFGGVQVQPPPQLEIPDSVLQRALAIFNARAPATTRSYGGTTLLEARHAGSYAMYGGDLLVRTTIEGNVVVINGDLRITGEGVVTGDVIVLGGRYSADAGATIRGTVAEYRRTASVRRNPDGTLVQAEPTPSLRERAGNAALRVGPVVLTPHFGLGVYNRVEGLPLAVGGTLAMRDPRDIALRFEGDVIVRTARDPSGIRDPLGWRGRLSMSLPGPQEFVVGIEAGQRMVATADRPFSDTESALSAAFLRRDYRDWFQSKDVAVTGAWSPTDRLTLLGRIGSSRQRSVASVDAFSFLRSSETWRPNPLVDDGKFLTLDVGASWDTRLDRAQPSDGWTVRGSVRRTSSDEITPIQLPVQVRNPLPGSGYSSWEASFLVRREQRLNPSTSVHAQLTGSGWLGGDPLTIQRRVALQGGDGLPAYSFREIRCDPRRQVIAAQLALCDRRMLAQIELRHTTGLRLGTNFGPYAVGIDQPAIVLFGDFGSAWLAGDGPGQVPSGRIQSLAEWRGDLGVGLDGGWLGVYAARSFTDNRPVRLVIRLQQRF